MRRNCLSINWKTQPGWKEGEPKLSRRMLHDYLTSHTHCPNCMERILALPIWWILWLRRIFSERWRDVYEQINSEVQFLDFWHGYNSGFRLDQNRFVCWTCIYQIQSGWPKNRNKKEIWYQKLLGNWLEQFSMGARLVGKHVCQCIRKWVCLLPTMHRRSR